MRSKVYSTCYETGKPPYYYCFEGINQNLCQFLLLSTSFRCFYRSSNPYCANISFRLFCKNETPDLTLQELDFFHSNWCLFTSECYALLLFLSNMNYFSWRWSYIYIFFLILDLEQDKKPEKSIIKVIYLEGFLHYNSFASEKTNLQFSSQNTWLSLNLSPPNFIQFMKTCSKINYY